MKHIFPLMVYAGIVPLIQQNHIKWIKYDMLRSYKGNGVALKWTSSIDIISLYFNILLHTQDHVSSMHVRVAEKI